MDIVVKGGQTLAGEVTPSGSKNSAVAIIPATVLFDKPVKLTNIPDITDVASLVDILRGFGSKIKWDKTKKIIDIDNKNLSFEKVDSESLGKMRGTSLLWGPMLMRFGKVNFGQLPGGCTLGFRTLSPHYKALESLGVQVANRGDGVVMDASHVVAGTVWMSEMSPTATANVIMLATGLSGVTKIVGAASEPQVQDLCNFLASAGAKISGIGSSVLVVEGVKSLSSVTHDILSDHYEITTFLAMGAVTGGEVRVKNATPDYFGYINQVFSKFGIVISYDGDTAVVKKGQKVALKYEEGRNLMTVKAQPWPGLPVDTLPLFIPIALTAASGHVLFHNWMYEAGLFWTSQLTKLGANIVMADPHRVIVLSGSKLKGAKMEAPYIIRATVAMVMAAMVSQGDSEILNAEALYRGHPHFAENLKKLGASIKEK
ncbi:hypothetical protein A3D84_00750 [Candidatus Woesebacteria bacterium RIFCSPHIGHO2_02_FULL_42_20]|uniref:UDP-N-acetylglucosamine 1-carboxyvinyltransferase n=1 Tax=Candidatus Woesebacteria bacterium RIFCSPHIGHO2_12_FULL_41_24 TaxID=1802510 RepID=A0A1F8APZ8_9BACT|nr:MAG: hypothetical protein A2W15_04975 [Candidatus Woesebacteria bacterium RBG_16_41_13]OGM30651.1 MAG: hypothetical protein A2873_00870 [Candidatus Woesebacteria bacterium RIFCSPHIGHO2_01_FULL_42_80]OGM35788.1 MAG: hypothetical protein A3D84_00750 [Candidatus Woesebacteria bacterium RIFCSPHIGHO2_02_FULL_42_20]OGM53847.1 MAG: hypothetical protein A3E44_05520 [Candidatus Woesebacteria bacterium RIFCSPHIGHO2_12_FULL_41_24]OGM66039.1 MAG: hypothetical protein A2969_03615 [Candidatus Woesebacteri